MSNPAKVAVFVSGGGSNLQSLINASKSGNLAARIVLVISNRDDAYGLERARREGIDTFVYNVKKYPDRAAAHKDLMEVIEHYDIEYIALAGYLKLIPKPLIRKYADKITNVHPALLPKYGGKGMYGHRVHEAVLKAGDTESGATIHIVDEIYDNGKILMQKKVPVNSDDTPDTLAARVLKVEHEIYPIALNNLITGKYQ